MEQWEASWGQKLELPRVSVHQSYVSKARRIGQMTMVQTTISVDIVKRRVGGFGGSDDSYPSQSKRGGFVDA